ncbi:MAG: class A beta-lactamase, subclass A2 [Candidatus Latescibacteria bacterium]|nr:class A beta-lactamase, subclass A2 [Candidatus Latescibacterota bacterium]
MTTVSARLSPGFRLCLRVSLALVLCCASAFAQASSKGGVRGQIEQISRAAKGRVGVAATVLETGESVAFHGNERFPMQSVYKMPIGMAVLNQVDRGALQLDQRVRVEKNDFVTALQYSPIRDKYPQGVELSVGDLLRFMVSESDGTACDVLLRLVGGAQVVTGYLRGLGVKGVVVATTEQEMGQDEAVQYRNWASPEAMVALLRALHEGRGLSEDSRALLLRRMTETTTGRRRLKGLLPAGTVVAHKTGTSRTMGGLTRATNDVGLVTLPNGRHLAVAVFISDSMADEAAREAVIAQVARAVWDSWSGPVKDVRPSSDH